MLKSRIASYEIELFDTVSIECLESFARRPVTRKLEFSFSLSPLNHVRCRRQHSSPVAAR